MALVKPQLNGDVLAYDEIQTDGINDLESRIGNLDENFITVGKGYIRTYANNNQGAGIMGSVFGNVPHVGFLYVVETEGPRFLIATFCKLAPTENPLVSILQSNGLTLGDTNSSGTQNIVGALNNDNVRMMAIHEKVF